MAYEKWWVGIAFGYRPDDPDPVYTDITSRVETIASPIDVTAGDTRETTGDGGSMSIRLDNRDQAFTPGNALSVYAPNVKSGVRIWIRETIGTLTFDLFQGFVEWPEIDSWTASTESAPRSQSITITAVDRLGRLRNSRRFISTLNAHIRGVGPSKGLVAYWPLNDGGAPADSVPSGLPLAERFVQQAFGVIDPTDPSTPSITYATAEPPPGDDVSYIEFAPARDVSTPGLVEITSYYALQGDATWLTISSSDVLTMVVWVRIPRPPGETTASLAEIMSLNSSTMYAALYLTTASRLEARASASTTADWATSTIAYDGRPGDAWVPIALRVGPSAGTAELWVGRSQTIGTVAVVTPGPVTAVTVDFGASFTGALAAAQIYLGAADDFTYGDFLEQQVVGLGGLDQQTTGERIRSILTYAGVPESEQAHIDDGVSVMQPASLAGQSPADAIGEAVETEQGAIYVRGDGVIDFADRRRRYNI